MHNTQLGSFLFLLFLSISHELKCYEGSKGEIKGETTGTFVEQQCEESMQYCFQSFNYDQTQVTAQCQLRSTDQKLLDICKVGCVNHTDVHIVICCCAQDLCNTSPYNFTNPNVEDEGETTTILTTTTQSEEPKVKREDGAGDEEERSMPSSTENNHSDTKKEDYESEASGTVPPQSGEAREIRRRRRRS